MIEYIYREHVHKCRMYDGEFLHRKTKDMGGVVLNTVRVCSCMSQWFLIVALCECTVVLMLLPFGCRISISLLFLIHFILTKLNMVLAQRSGHLLLVCVFVHLAKTTSVLGGYTDRWNCCRQRTHTDFCSLPFPECRDQRSVGVRFFETGFLRRTFSLQWFGSTGLWCCWFSGL